MKSIARLQALDAEGWVAKKDIVLNGSLVHGRDDLDDLVLGAWRRAEIVTDFEDVPPL